MEHAADSTTDGEQHDQVEPPRKRSHREDLATVLQTAAACVGCFGTALAVSLRERTAEDAIDFAHSLYAAREAFATMLCLRRSSHHLLTLQDEAASERAHRLKALHISLLQGDVQVRPR